MTISKMTRTDKEKLWNKLTARKRNLENGLTDQYQLESKYIIEYLHAFYKMSWQEQQKRRTEWNQYYEKVQGTIIFELFTAQREAARIGDWGRVKELANEAKQMRLDGTLDNLPKPQHIDPFELDFGVVCAEYREINKRLEELKDAPVYETKKALSQEADEAYGNESLPY